MASKANSWYRVILGGFCRSFNNTDREANGARSRFCGAGCGRCGDQVAPEESNMACVLEEVREGCVVALKANPLALEPFRHLFDGLRWLVGGGKFVAGGARDIRRGLRGVLGGW